MATRTIFNIFGSLGPGGAIVSITEKICSSTMPDAYNFGDPEKQETELDKELKKLREQYILELFKFKNEFRRSINEKVKQPVIADDKGGNQEDMSPEKKPSTSQEAKEQAYKKLVNIIKRYIERMTRLEKNKYMRERIYYQRNHQQILYEQANKKYNKARDDVTDNLVKQCKTVCEPSEKDFQKYFEEFHVEFKQDDEDVNNIYQRVTETKAREFYNKYIDLDNQAKQDIQKVELLKNQDKESMSDKDRELYDKFTDINFNKAQHVKDQLFIETGEDWEDIELAIKHFNVGQIK